MHRKEIQATLKEDDRLEVSDKQPQGCYVQAIESLTQCFFELAIGRSFASIVAANHTVLGFSIIHEHKRNKDIKQGIEAP